MIYIDAECKCHVSNPNGMYTAVEIPPELVGKCPAYIEGFRFRPDGYTYEREDGVGFGPAGDSISPWRDIAILNEFQAQYEAQQAEVQRLQAELADADEALHELSVEWED